MEYRVAFLDWLACAAAGSPSPIVNRARLLGDHVAAVGTAGHVLDFDDTYLPGIAHLSAPVAPAALVTAARLGRTVGDALDAYAEGFEAMGALARAGHPALYDSGWHPTAVCGGVGAAVAAAALLDVDREIAVAFALVRASGLRASFGSDAKALQVGFAASAGVQAARLALADARIDAASVRRGWEVAHGAVYAQPDDGRRAIDENWVKAYPCCLQTHGAIEAALAVAGDSRAVPADAPVEVVVHPVSRQAAWVEDPRTGLEAKFSIPYLTAWVLRTGRTPVAGDFADDPDPAARAFAAERIAVRTSRELAESEARLAVDGEELARIDAARGSPLHPLGEAELRDKVRDLAGERLTGVLDDPGRPAAEVLAALGV